MEYKSDVDLVDPYHTSKDCSRCGCTNKDLNGEKFVCVNKNCGLAIDRQFNAPINVYIGMEGLSQNTGRFDEKQT
jgi:transposase